MQISVTVNNYLTHTFHLKEKLLEKETGYCKLEIYESESYGRVFVLDQTHVFLENEMPMLDEMAAHVSACTHFTASRALVLGGINVGIAAELLKHPGMQVDMVEKDGTLIQTVREYTPYQEEVWQNPNFSFVPSDGREWIRGFNADMYDIVIFNSSDAISEADSETLAAIDRILKPDGICILRCGHVIYHHESVKSLLVRLGESFLVTMPFMPFHTSVPYGFIYASKKSHPTADLYLQKADMLDGVSYYTGEFHKAAFALPKFLEQAFKGIAKN